MKKVAVFGKPGSGKSTLSKELSAATGIELHPIDLFEYQKNGQRIPKPEYTDVHENILNSEKWIIDGLGYLDSFWRRVDAADTLIYVDLPYYVSYWWVAKRLLTSIFVKPEGWPVGCSVLKGAIAGWKYLRLSPKFWTPDLFREIQLRGKGKDIYRITSVKEINTFAKQFGGADVRI